MLEDRLIKHAPVVQGKIKVGIRRLSTMSNWSQSSPAWPFQVNRRQFGSFGAIVARMARSDRSEEFPTISNKTYWSQETKRTFGTIISKETI